MNDYGPIQAPFGMKATAAGTNSRIRIAAGEPIRAISEDASENGGRSKGTAGRDSVVASEDGAGSTVTVYGPRCGEKVKVTIDIFDTERLLITFHNLDLKGKSKAKNDGDAKMQEAKQDDEACQMDFDG